MRWFDKIVRLEDIKWLERLVRHNLSVGIVPTLLRRAILAIQETILLGLTTTVARTVSIIESVNVAWIWGILYSEIVSMIESVATFLYETVIRSFVEGLSLFETVTVNLFSGINVSVSEIASLVEGITYQLQTQSTLQWDYSVAYDQQGNQITLDLSSLQDNNTATAVNIYYSPPAPSNPRRFVVGWNEARWFMQINIHINGYTTGKQLIVTIRDSFGYSQVSVLNLTGTGWYYVYPDFYEISNVKEVEFAPDTSVMGYIGISEVWFIEL